jgi:8-oxo-dGTP pyrophosphatase MutT (NUDIX family)
MIQFEVPEGYREAAGCIVMRRTDECILLLRRSIHETSWHGMYELPGGKLEDGETPEDTARIETKEEAGVDVEIKKVYHMYLAHLPEGAEINISEEHDDIKWVSLEGAVALHHPNDGSEALNSLSHHARFGIEHLLQE